MKFTIIFACLLAISFANEESNVISEKSDVGVDHFEYSYETDKNTKVSQQGHMEEHDNWVVNGQFEYVSKEGEPIKLSYVADETGFHPDPNSPLLPTPPPIPDYILKAIAYIEAHPSKDAH